VKFFYFYYIRKHRLFRSNSLRESRPARHTQIQVSRVKRNTQKREQIPAPGLIRQRAPTIGDRVSFMVSSEDIYLNMPVAIQVAGEMVRFDHSPVEEYCTQTPVSGQLATRSSLPSPSMSPAAI